MKFYEYDEMNRGLMTATYVTESEMAGWDAQQRAEEQRLAVARATGGKK